MRKHGIRKAQIALLSTVLSLAYTQSSYAQIYSENEKTAQNARQSGYAAMGQKNYFGSVKYFEIGCSRGSADSCVQLGMLYNSNIMASNPDQVKAII